MTIDEMMTLEEQSMGRPCQLYRANVIEIDGHQVATLVYRVDPARNLPGDIGEMHEVRAALFVDDRALTGVVVATEFKR